MTCKCGAVMCIDDRDRKGAEVTTWYLCEACLMSCVETRRNGVVLNTQWVPWDGVPVSESVL